MILAVFWAWNVILTCYHQEYKKYHFNIKSVFFKKVASYPGMIFLMDINIIFCLIFCIVDLNLYMCYHNFSSKYFFKLNFTLDESHLIEISRVSVVLRL